MNLLKTSLLSLLATSCKMLAGLAIGKAAAIYTGPSGLATIGQFQNFIQIALTFAKGAMDTGVTKYTAEYAGDQARLSRMLTTALRLSAATCLLVVIILMVAAEVLSQYFLGRTTYAYVMRLFGVTIFLFVLNSLLLAILNGLREIRTYIIANILQSAVMLVLTTALIVALGIDGALIALVLNQSVVLFVLLWNIRGHLVIRLQTFRSAFDRQEAVRLCRFAAMGMVSAICTPLSIIFVRNHLTDSFGSDATGYWQGVWQISSIYLTVVTTSLSVYFLPKLSSLTDRYAIQREIINGYRLIMPIIVASALLIYLARDFIIWALFTEAFMPMRDLFFWMLIGDAIKIASWILAYLMLAKAMTTAFVATEITFSVSFVVLSVVLTDQFGLAGVTYAYAANYCFYLLAVGILTRRYWSTAN